jgi:hypothetical protein
VRVTANEMAALGHTPVDVYDASGMVIEEAITAIDAEMGLVEYYVLGTDGCPLHGPDGAAIKRWERFPAPLTWKKVTPERVAQAKERLRRRAVERQGGER